MNWPLPHQSIDIRVLSFLVGKWCGEGTASFPTIKTANYFDEMIFELDESAGLIFYTQKTSYNTDGEKGNTLHMESGFIRITENRCELVNSQSNGRTEVMQALFFAPGNAKRIYFMSTFFSNDPRMLKTRRDITVQNDILTYEMKMATKANRELQTHLTSTLRKQVNEL